MIRKILSLGAAHIDRYASPQLEYIFVAYLGRTRLLFPNKKI
jgi:hypothetical protein